MNRVWLFRILGILTLVVFTLLMWNLYSNLVKLQTRTPRPRPPATTTSKRAP